MTGLLKVTQQIGLVFELTTSYGNVFIVLYLQLEGYCSVLQHLRSILFSIIRFVNLNQSPWISRLPLPLGWLRRDVAYDITQVAKAKKEKKKRKSIYGP